MDWEAGPETAAAKAELDDHWRWWNEVYLKDDLWDSEVAGITPPRWETGQVEINGQLLKASRMVHASEEECQRWKEWQASERQREKDREDELDRRLKRLIDLRGFLWS